MRPWRRRFPRSRNWIPKLEPLESRTLLAGVTLTQLTDTANDFASTNPALSDDGTKVAFQSVANLLGNSVGGNSEIYLFDTLTNSISQVTDAPVGESCNVSISGDGTRLAFQSNADLTGGNADGNVEVLLFDATSETVSQVTDTAGGGSSAPAISGDGARVVFESTADLTGDNPDANSEIFLFDSVVGTFLQVTDTTGAASSGATINIDGTVIAFSSTADLTGDNADGSSEIFVYDAAAGSLAQVTDAAGVDSSHPSTSGDGTKIAYQTGESIELFDIATGTVTLEPNGTRPSISRNGENIIYTRVEEEYSGTLNQRIYVSSTNYDDENRISARSTISYRNRYLLFGRM